ncbi:hypothetical protein SRABI106_01828 [Rahnella aquatilis]|nr:hypothetical protein SRABI106_01828 [Rahnella aquatilis]
MTHAGAAVDVIGADHCTGKFLHHIVGFIAGPAGRTGGHNGTRAVFLFNVFQALCGVTDGFIPADGFEFSAFLAADERLGQARGQQFGVIEKIPAVIAFQAQFALIGDAVRGFRTDDFSVIYNQI